MLLTSVSSSAKLFDVTAVRKSRTENFFAANLDISALNRFKHALLFPVSFKYCSFLSWETIVSKGHRQLGLILKLILL